MRIALDTNVLVYTEGVSGEARQQAALDIIATLPRASTFIPVQVLGELFRVLTGKSSVSPKQAHARLASWQLSFPLIDTTASVFSIVILAAAAEAQCRLLLSEDMQDGFTWGGVTVANPFAAKRHELLARVLGE